MSSKAHVEYDPALRGGRLALTRGFNGHHTEVVHWSVQSVLVEPEARADEAAWLLLPEDDLRAIYEALAEFFGHAGHDIRALRKDYDAERGRVDRLINNLIGNSR